MFDDIRNLLIIIPSIIAIIGGIGKISYNFFIESVKYEYKRVPAQQTNIGIMFNVALCIIIIIDIVGVALLFIGFIIGSSSENKMDATTVPLAWILIIMIILSGVNFNIVRTKYIDKLNKHKYEKVVGWTFLSIIINIIFWGLISIILSLVSMSTIIKGINIKSNLGRLVFESSLTYNDYYGITVCGIIAVFCVILFMISLSLFEIAYIVNKYDTYYIIRKDDVISCECYLDYIDYYLVIDNGVERYIKKSDVTEIKKVKGKLTLSIKKKRRFNCNKVRLRKYIKRNRQNTDI